MPLCSIKQCSARKTKNQPTLTLHRLPKKEVLRRKWLDAIGADNINSRHKEVYICSLHFEVSEFNRTLDTIRLRDNAIPTLFNVPSASRRNPNTPAKENLDLSHKMASASKHVPVLFKIVNVKKNVSPKNYLPPAREMPLTSEDVPVLCKPHVITKKNNQPKEDLPAGNQVDPQFRRLAKLEKMCNEQRKKIKILHEKIRRQGKKIASLEMK